MTCICLLAPVAMLRWPLPILLQTVRGDGVMDRTVVAFLIPVALLLAGYPGYAAAALRPRIHTRLSRWFRIAGILLVLIASLLILLWMMPTVLRMGSTLRDPVHNLGWLTPPLLSAVCCVVLRSRFRPG